MAKSNKPAPIIIKGGQKFKDPKWAEKVFKPYEPAFPQKIYDPKKGKTGIST
jgi:hypothetical protein